MIDGRITAAIEPPLNRNPGSDDGGERRLKQRKGMQMVRPLCTLVLASLLVGSFIAVAGAQFAPPPGAYAHVYLIRGFLNVFSWGMDEMAAKLQQQGIRATVHSHMAWSRIADEAAAEYESGQVRTIILVGHSAGADAIAKITARLGELDIPVKLAIDLDPGLSHLPASGHVERYVNYYVSTGIGHAIAKSPQFKGTLENVDVSNMPGVWHFSIDKNQAMEDKVMSDIYAAL